MVERVATSSYHQLQHFISDSQWAHGPVLQRFPAGTVGRDISDLLAATGEAYGLTIDEEGHVKKGQEPVGVARQYLGSIGKVDNGQVSVFAALNQGDDVAMVNVKLFLPKAWVDSKKRLEKAGVPLSAQVFKRKWELALEMIDELAGVVSYEWINADGYYGNAQGVRAGLTHRNQLFVLDIHQDQSVYVLPPNPYLPPWSGKGRESPLRGRPRRKPSKLTSEQAALEVRQLMNQLQPLDWKTYTFRQATKGPMIRQVYTRAC